MQNILLTFKTRLQNNYLILRVYVIVYKDICYAGRDHFSPMPIMDLMVETPIMCADPRNHQMLTEARNIVIQGDHCYTRQMLYEVK